MTNLGSVVRELKAERDRAAKQLARLDEALAALNGAGVRRGTTPRGKSKISVAGRARIAAAQRARWAKVKAERLGPTKAKRTLSVAARRKIAAAQRARWAKVKSVQKAA